MGSWASWAVAFLYDRAVSGRGVMCGTGRLDGCERIVRFGAGSEDQCARDFKWPWEVVGFGLCGLVMLCDGRCVELLRLDMNLALLGRFR